MREGGGGGPFERMDHAQLIQGFSDQTKVAVMIGLPYKDLVM